MRSLPAARARGGSSVTSAPSFRRPPSPCGFTRCVRSRMWNATREQRHRFSNPP